MKKRILSAMCDGVLVVAGFGTIVAIGVGLVIFEEMEQVGFFEPIDRYLRS